MDWMGVFAVTILLVGIGAGGYLAARSPSFWIGVVTELGKKALPFILKRMTPEEEKEWHDALNRGKGDEWLKERFLRKAREAKRKASE